jgi:hypothetical protein
MNKSMLFVGGLFALALAVPAVAGFSAKSGLAPGESISAFHPVHISGPLANSEKCFPCTFQSRPQVQVWVNGDDPKNIVAIAKNLQSEINKNKKAEFKAMIVVLGDKAALKPVVKAAATEANTPDVAMAILPKTDEAVKNYKINLAADVKNTVFVYRNWKVSDSMVNLKADTKGLNALNAAIAKAVAM